MLEIKKESEELQHPGAQIVNSTIIPPCYIGEGVQVSHAVVGPYVSLEKGSVISNSVISHSIIGQRSTVKNSVISKSMLGNDVICLGKSEEFSLGDFSFKNA
jgi:glucose-1-phosphate thymidylyltransferase